MKMQKIAILVMMHMILIKSKVICHLFMSACDLVSILYLPTVNLYYYIFQRNDIKKSVKLRKM